MRPTKYYRYAPRGPRTIALIVFTSIAGLVLGYMGLSFEWGVTLFRFIDLGPGPGSLVLVLLGLVNLVVAGLSVRALIEYKHGEHFVTLGDDTISIPSRWGTEVTRIPYAEIDKLWVQSVMIDEILCVRHAEGSAYVSRAMLESREHMAELWRELQVRVRMRGRPT